MKENLIRSQEMRFKSVTLPTRPGDAALGLRMKSRLSLALGFPSFQAISPFQIMLLRFSLLVDVIYKSNYSIGWRVRLNNAFGEISASGRRARGP